MTCPWDEGSAAFFPSIIPVFTVVPAFVLIYRLTTDKQIYYFCPKAGWDF
jgi:hypothetical protein